MGLVYLARDPNIEREVALKTVRFDIEAQSFKLEEAKARFLKEAKISGRLQHPHIVTIFDVGEDAGILYLAMEYVAGGSFAQRIVEPDPLPVEEKIRVVAEVAEALGHAHERGVIHRDVKPANILLTESLSAKVTDFGIGKLLSGDTDLTSTGQMVGSPAYMSPEQIKGEKLDVRSDIFSLGIVLYQALTGRKPFPAETLTTLVYQILHEEPVELLELHRDLPPPLSDIVKRCLAKRREDRYSDAGEVAVELENLLGFAPVTSTSALSESKVRRGRRLQSSGTGPRPIALVGGESASVLAGSGGDESRTETVVSTAASTAAATEITPLPIPPPAATPVPSPLPAQPPAGGRRAAVVAGAVAVLALAGLAGGWKLGLLGGPAPSPTPAPPTPSPVASAAPVVVSSPPPEGTPGAATSTPEAGLTPTAPEPSPAAGTSGATASTAPPAAETTKKPRVRTSPTPAPTATPVPATPTPKPAASYNITRFVKLFVTPPQARVFLDGRYIGTADDWDDKGGGSQLIFYEAEGTHRLRFTHPEMRDLLIDLVVNPTAPSTVEVKQKLDKGSPDGPTGPEGKLESPEYRTVGPVKITVEPPEARITLDGVEVAAGERRLEPANKVYEGLVTAPGHAPQSFRILVSGATSVAQANVKVKLKKQ